MTAFVLRGNWDVEEMSSILSRSDSLYNRHQKNGWKEEVVPEHSVFYHTIINETCSKTKKRNTKPCKGLNRHLKTDLYLFVYYTAIITRIN